MRKVQNTHWFVSQCMECNKIFLHANFLAEHIQRRHGGQLESAARLSSVKSKAGHVLGLGGEQSAEEVNNSNKQQQERMRSVKRKGPPQRGQSHGFVFVVTIVFLFYSCPSIVPAISENAMMFAQQLVVTFWDGNKVRVRSKKTAVAHLLQFEKKLCPEEQQQTKQQKQSEMGADGQQ